MLRLVQLNLAIGEKNDAERHFCIAETSEPTGSGTILSLAAFL